MGSEERDRKAVEEREQKDQAKIEENRARQLRQGVISEEESKEAKEPKEESKAAAK